jgi:hypothetical protein
MRFIFDIQDEQNILKEMSRSRDKAESIGKNYTQQGRIKRAAKWVKSAQLVSMKIKLLEQVFERKN